MQRLTSGLSHLRGAALKLGQMLSMDTGLVLPDELTAILARMRDDARHMPPKQLQTVLNAEWGEGWHRRFARFDVRPFAAASIGQVHRAVTRDGRDLAIKVQYPGVRASIDSDVDNMATLLRLPGVLPRGMDLAPLMAEAKRQLHAEADYAAEAEHLGRFGALLAGSDSFALPELQADLCTPHVLAMTYLDSAPLDSLVGAPQDLRDRVAVALIELVLRELFAFGLMQTDLRSPLAVSDLVRDFEQGALADAAARVGVAATAMAAQDPGDLAEWAASAGAAQIATPYITRGPLRDWLDRAAPSLARAGITLCEWRRDWDAAIWPHATAGFFKVKQMIPRILDRTLPS